VTIRARPGTVYCGALVTLAVEPPPGRGLETRWAASTGLLLWDDLAEVAWRAPPAPGTAVVTVTISRSRPRTSDPAASAASPSEGEPLDITQSLRLEVSAPSTAGMVWIPPGSFLRGDVLGTANTEELKTVQNASDEPCHLVHVDGFWIDRYPVTNRRYAEFLEAAVREGLAEPTEVAVFGEFEGSRVPYYYFRSYVELIPDYHATRNARTPAFFHVLRWEDGRFRVQPGAEDRPVVDVSWFGAAAFARFHGKELPTEAEWEKAARGADRRRFPWGNNLPTVYHGNLDHRLGREPAPVGRFSPLADSPYGVADMLSSAFEWTSDWFNIEHYADIRAGVPIRNPTGPFWGKAHTIRGSPSALSYRAGSVDPIEPVSTRYDWRFEFLLGDMFANGETTFRTAVRAFPPPSRASEGGGGTPSSRSE
jgi:formylglycine-generating enzyme required for sulfatase activity